MTGYLLEIYHFRLFVHMYSVGMEVDAGDSGSEGDFSAKHSNFPFYQILLAWLYV